MRLLKMWPAIKKLIYCFVTTHFAVPMKAPKVEAAHIVNKLLFLHNLLSVVCAFPHPPAPACARCGAHGMCLMSGKKEDSNERLRVGFPAAEVLNG